MIQTHRSFLVCFILYNSFMYTQTYFIHQGNENYSETQHRRTEVSKLSAEVAATAPASTPSSPSLSFSVFDYNGGPVLHEPISIYAIWYGNWTEPEKAVVRNFVKSIPTPQYSSNGAPSVYLWWSLAREYSDMKGRHVLPNVTWMDEVNDNYTLGRLLNGNALEPTNDIAEIVKTHLGLPFPNDTEAIYVVFTGHDVFTTGFCSVFTAFHGYINTTDSLGQQDPSQFIKYMFVGNPDQGPYSDCAPPASSSIQSPSTSSLWGAEFAVRAFARELVNTATDPISSTGWYSPSSGELADICEYFTLPTFTEENMTYNVIGINNQKFLISGIWSRRYNQCQMQKALSPSPPPPPPSSPIPNALSSTNYSQFLLLLQRYNLDFSLWALNEPVTIFAPNNAAILALGYENIQKIELSGLMDRVVLFHVAKGYENYKSLVSKPGRLPRKHTFFITYDAGDPLTATSDGSIVIVGWRKSVANVSDPDVFLNGKISIQGIDTVLIPRNVSIN